MMFWDFVASNLRGESRVLEMADGIVDRIFDRAWKLMMGRIVDLPVGEARGYVQARAGLLLRDEVLAQCGSQQFAAVYAQAMALTVERAIDRAHHVRARSIVRRAA